MESKTMTDLTILKRIEKYLGLVADCYADIRDMRQEEFLENLLAPYALTQLLTNIYLLYKKLPNSISSEMPIFGKQPLNRCAYIATHNYGSLNWPRVMSLCNELLSNRTQDLLQAQIKLQLVDFIAKCRGCRRHPDFCYKNGQPGVQCRCGMNLFAKDGETKDDVVEKWNKQNRRNPKRDGFDAGTSSAAS